MNIIITILNDQIRHRIYYNHEYQSDFTALNFVRMGGHFGQFTGGWCKSRVHATITCEHRLPRDEARRVTRVELIMRP